MSFLQIGKRSLGMGDRFAHQAAAQLRAIQQAEAKGALIEPVWNKSNREHAIIGSRPESVRAAAAAAVQALGWKHPWYVDADHIRLETVDAFLASSDFFTIDVADAIGQPAPAADLAAFVARHPELAGRLEIPGIERAVSISRDDVTRTAGRYLAAVRQAGQIYRHIAKIRGAGRFVCEISMDETDAAQTPTELLVILAAIADEGIPIQTIAPKFTGRFNKGVDYVGDLEAFEREFNDDLAVVAHAVRRGGLPANLKLSVHSGSDKFSLYRPIRRALARFDAGVHVKTAGTTWLEELIGLAESGGAALAMAKKVYAEALAHREEFCAPYATVIDVDPARLPSADAVARWSSAQYVAALRHDPKNREFNPHLRQLLHVSYKVAAKAGREYLDLLGANASVIGRNVTENLYERHLKPLFLE